MPLEPECRFVEYGDLEGVERAVDETVAGVFIEPIQGEAGVIIPDDGFIRGIRKCCDDRGALMIDDEVQSGMGRTGAWLAIEHTGVKPDIVTLAKGIASGFPMGALAAREGLEFKKSEHGSTFAGGPLACAAALATIRVIEEAMPEIPRKGERCRNGLSAYNPRVRGLMIGITVGDRCAGIQRKCAEQGVLINCAADGNIRLVPPLIISDAEIDTVIEVLHGALG
jgi:acetylornithine/N-succinyldiaminopimelate aminotransferase